MNQSSEVRGMSALEQLLAEEPERKINYGQLRQFLRGKAQTEGVPLHGTLELTPLCNLDCKMCYVHLTGEKMKGQSLLPVEQWKTLIKEAAEMGMMDATLTGGECLTYPQFDEIYLFLHALGIQVAVLTNGLLLTEERIRFFRKHPPQLIQVSLYGCSEAMYEDVTGHRVFATVLEHIQKARAAGLPLTLAITPSRFLADRGLELVEFVDGLGIPYNINTSLFPPREETGRREVQMDLTIEEYIRLFTLRAKLNGREIRKQPSCELLQQPLPGRKAETACFGLRCSAGNSSFAIGWDGTLTPCGVMHAIRAFPLQTGMQEAWESIHKEALVYPVPAECDPCEYHDLCPSCVMAHAAEAPVGHASRYFCERVQALTAAGLVPIRNHPE